jgi:heme exporter protein C
MPPFLGWLYKVATGVLLACATYAALAYLPPAEGFLYPDGARIIVWHVPCAWIAALSYIVAAFYAVRVLVQISKPENVLWRHSDSACNAAMELGLLFSVLTTVTGSIFSRLQWGAFWSWDPRQTSIVVIMLLFAAYLVLRGAIGDRKTCARLCSAYGIIAVIPGLFLIWVLPRIVNTLHGGANQAVIGGGLDAHYRLVMYGLSLPGFLGLFVWLMQLRMRVDALANRIVGRSPE